MATKFNDYSLSTDAYAAFDALSLKSLLIKRLNDTGTVSYTHLTLPTNREV